jgi:hypothetical protein
VAKRGSHPDLDPRIGLVRIPSPTAASVTPQREILIAGSHRELELCLDRGDDAELVA